MVEYSSPRTKALQIATAIVLMFIAAISTPVYAADYQAAPGMMTKAKVGDPDRAPDSNRPPLAKEFGDDVPEDIRRRIDNAEISVDGFSIIRTVTPVVMCVSELNLQEALAIFYTPWRRYPPGCIDVPPGTEVEWYRLDPTFRGSTRLRANAGHGAVEIYARSQWQGGAVNAWFELIPRARPR